MFIYLVEKLTAGTYERFTGIYFIPTSGLPNESDLGVLRSKTRDKEPMVLQRTLFTLGRWVLSLGRRNCFSHEPLAHFVMISTLCLTRSCLKL